MKRNGYLLFVLAAGIIGAVLRGLSITKGLDWDYGLPVRGYAPSLLLKLLCVAAAVLAVVLARRLFPKQDKETYEAALGQSSFSARLICMVCGIAMTVVGAAALVNVGSMTAEQTNEWHAFGRAAFAALIAQWALCAASGLALAMFAWRQDGRAATKGQGVLVVLPMFWACLDLIMTYHENSSNPVMADYAYELLLAIALMAAFYTMAGFFFATPSAGRTAVAAGLAVVLTLVVDGGFLLSLLMDATMLPLTLTAVLSDLFRMVIYVLTGVYLLVQLTQIKSGMKTV